MDVRRVFVIWTHPLFIESLRLLLNHPGIEWTGATSDLAAAPEQIALLHPDSILIEENPDGTLPAEALEILKTDSSDLRLIQLNLNDNQLTVYLREQRTIGHIEELLALI